MGRKRNLNQIHQVILHCSATPNGRADTAVDIDRYHRERSFSRDMSISPTHQPELKHIGYHYVIELDGTSVAGRPLTETGAHCKGQNSDSVGICLIGTDQFSKAQWLALAGLVQALHRQLPSDLSISGHRIYNPHKTCPGFDVDTWLAGNMQPLETHIFSEQSESSASDIQTVEKEKPMGWFTELFSAGTSSIVNSIGDLAGKFITTDKDRNAFRLQVESLLQQRDSEIEQTIRRELSAKQKILEAELNQGDAYTKRARPTVVYFGLMVIFINYVLVPNALLLAMVTGAPELTIEPAELPTEFWVAWGGICSVWVVGRSAEKRGLRSTLIDSVVGKNKSGNSLLD